MTGRDPRRFADFEVTGPLPRGTTLLEASAGTGKTWTIGALVARYVIDAGVDLRDILVITFGRAASQELRERVRQQLVEAEQLLARPDEHRGRDRFGDLLIGDDPDEVPLRHARARAALADFDAATIATTHQFCHLVLESLGVAGDTDPAATLVEDLDDLTHQVVEDLYLRKYALTEAAARVTWSAALAVARAVINDPQARIEPRAEPGDTTVGQRVAFATAVRAELERRKRRLGIIGYDDLLAHLSAALREPDAPARQRLRQRWRIVLVDEFQDTDPVQ